MLPNSLRLPRGAVWKAREYTDSVKLKVVVPGMGKELVMDMFWVDDDKMFDDQLMIVIEEVGEIEGEGDKDLENDEPPAWQGPCICFLGDTFERQQIEADIKNGVVVLTLPKISKDE